MKMSPWRSQGVLQGGVAVVERDAAVESLVDLNFRAGEAETAGLLGDLEALALSLHDVVVADDAVVEEAADAVQIFGRETPGSLHFARSAGEAAVVVGEEVAEHGIGGVQVASLSEAKFAGEAILEHAPEAFDAAFSLRTAGSDEGDAELLEGAAELRGLSFSRELFFHRPEVVVADEDATVIAIKRERDAVAAQQLAEQREKAGGGFGGEELGGQDFSGGIVLHAERGQSRAAAFEPVMGRAIELDQFAFAGRSQTALTMGGSAAEGEALDLAKFFAEVVIVEAGVGGAGQAQYSLAHRGRQATGTGLSAVGVRQSRLPLLPQTFLETFDLTDAKREQFGGSGARHVSLGATGNHAHSL